MLLEELLELEDEVCLVNLEGGYLPLQLVVLLLQVQQGLEVSVVLFGILTRVLCGLGSTREL